MKVSVIIPVFNSEQYLYKCLESVMSQTLTDIEIICIDDGSTDNSLPILLDYQKKDERIRIVQQENQGAGVARNVGIEIAQGEYLHFLDSDDFINPLLYELMYENASADQADISFFAGWRFDHSTGKILNDSCCFLNLHCFPMQQPFSWRNIPDSIFQLSSPNVWSKIFRAGFVRKNNLVFPDTKSANDMPFYFRALIAAERINYLNKRLIYYRINNEHSITKKESIVSTEAFEGRIRLFKEFEKMSCFKSIKRSFINEAIGAGLTDLNQTKNAEAFSEKYVFFRNEYAITLNFSAYPASFFYVKSYWEQFCLIEQNESALDYLFSVIFSRDKNSGSCAIPELDSVLNSWSYRIGRIITAVPRKAIVFWRRLRRKIDICKE